MRLLPLFAAVLCFVPVYAQPSTERTVEAVRTSAGISIDGRLDEEAWASCVPATDFTQYEPIPNVPATLASEVSVLYDDDALYVGALLLDPAVDSLLFRLWKRDEVQIGDWFSVTVDPYRSGQNGFEYLVSAANVQTDMVIVDEDEDVSWNAVWQSAVGLTDRGWIVELRIPWSAIRFPRVEVQDWNINFIRHVGRSREKSFWSAVDPQKEGWLRQAGKLRGVRSIEPPMRLALYPYASAYLEHYPYGIEGVNDWSRSLNGGMDLKLGLSDAYTLDMTLVPDFGQVVSDNVVLNLSPFEVQYNENRQFFTEGMDLFQRGDLFYSRRIGGEPFLRDDLYGGLQPGETVIEDPSASQLINATKISGRGRNGLGMGVLNAITSNTFGVVRDSLGEERDVLTDPLTNYNVLVVDQLVKNNGFVSLTNTNVLRDGAAYDANATALSFLLNNKARSLQISGSGATTARYGPDEDADPGYRTGLEIAKTGGNWNYGTELSAVDRYFDPNDLGIFFFDNMASVNPYISYTNYKPKGRWMRWSVDWWAEYSRVIEPDHFFNFATGMSTFRVDKSFNAFGANLNLEPVLTYDPYEPRVFGRVYEYPRNARIGGFISTDYSKRFAVDANFSYRWFDERDRKTIAAGFEPRVRLNDKLFIVLELSHEFADEDLGWVAFVPEEGADDRIIMGRRDRWTTSNTLRADHTLNNRMSLTARVRHYWSRAHYVEYSELDDQGRLENTDYAGQAEDGSSLHDVDFDAFNVDLVFSWFFAPGSVLTLGWKNSIYSSTSSITEDYFYDLSSTLAAPQTNSFSLKVLYYVDAGGLLRGRKRIEATLPE